MSFELTSGALSRLINGETVNKPIVQILGYKKIPGNVTRYRLLISDGEKSHSAFMLATRNNERLEKGEFESFTIVSLNRFLINHTPAKKKVFVILDLNVMHQGKNVGKQIGNPEQVLQGDNKIDFLRDDRNQSSPEMYEPSDTSDDEFEPGTSDSLIKREQPIRIEQQCKMVLYPIARLSPYLDKWTIRARVTNKTNIHHWNNPRGEGKLFSFDLIDETGEIRAIVFTDFVDKFFDMIEVNKIYYISQGVLKTANKKFNAIKNSYEITFSPETTVEICDDADKIPEVKYKFIPIKDLAKRRTNSMFDVIGICKYVEDISTFTSKTKGDMIKRVIHLVDQTGFSVPLILWKNDAEKFDGSNFPIIAIKGAKLIDLGGKSLTTLLSSLTLINPDIEQAHTLRNWYNKKGSSLAVEPIFKQNPTESKSVPSKSSDSVDKQSHSESQPGASINLDLNWKTFNDIKSENMGSDKLEYYCVKGTIVGIKKESCLYQVCTNCNKKIIDLGNGLYKCEKCKLKCSNVKWCLLLNANLADVTNNQWAICFQETGEILLGKTSEELGNLLENDPKGFDQIFMDAIFKDYIFKVRTKLKTYNDGNHLKIILLSVICINHNDYNKKLISDIVKFQRLL